MDLIFHKPHHISLTESSCFWWICFTSFVKDLEQKQQAGKAAIYRRSWLKVSAQRAMEYFQEVGEQEAI